MGNYTNLIPRTAEEFLKDDPSYSYIPLEYIQGGIDRFDRYINDAGWEEVDLYDGDGELQSAGVHRHIAIDVFVHMPDKSPELAATKAQILAKLIKDSDIDDSSAFTLEEIKEEAEAWIKKNTKLSARNKNVLSVLQSVKANINSLIQDINNRKFDDVEKGLEDIKTELATLNKTKKVKQ